MKNKYLNIIFVLFNLWSYVAFSQTKCEVPEPPVLMSVSVQPETGFTEFKWTLSPSSDIAAYVVYSYTNENGVPKGIPIDTLWDPAASSYIYANSPSKYYSESYVISVFRLPRCESPFSNILNTMFADAQTDTCNKKIRISWNKYNSYPKNVTGYSILVSVNNGSFTEAGMVTSKENSFTLNDFTTDAKYCFVVKALLEGGSVSFSNKSCLNTKMQRPPQWIIADYATIDDNRNIALSFTFDPLSEIRIFRLERKTGSDNVFKQVAQIESGNGSVTYTDKTAEPEQINFYRLSAINNCGNPVVVSNLASNIVLILQRPDNVINLTWNPYKNWFGGVSGYAIYMNTGDGFTQKYVVQPTDTIYSINYSEIMNDITVEEVCFYVKAIEETNPHGISGESKSVTVCTEIIEKITVPNTFTPNNDMVNDFFKPVLSFTPLDYHLVITDRQNNILFESRDYLSEWDGTQNGASLPQGVYLWFLKIKTPSGRTVSRTGNLTIIKDK